MQLSLKEILQPAIMLAEEGFPVSSVTAHVWSQGITPFFAHKKNPDKDDFLTNGQAPCAGDVMKMPHLAETFKVHQVDIHFFFPLFISSLILTFFPSTYI
jgi:gamma-glutamyltranspeptidase/glutathione hydrolase